MSRNIHYNGIGQTIWSGGEGRDSDKQILQKFAQWRKRYANLIEFYQMRRSLATTEDEIKECISKIYHVSSNDLRKVSQKKYFLN